jgi:hypothetical protein
LSKIAAVLLPKKKLAGRADLCEHHALKLTAKEGSEYDIFFLALATNVRELQYLAGPWAVATSSKPLSTVMAMALFPIRGDAAERIRDFSFHPQRARELRG